jgi:hypothetical protein
LFILVGTTNLYIASYISHKYDQFQSLFGSQWIQENVYVTFHFTFSFRGLSVGESPQRLQVSSSAVNYNAGADVLHKYQSQWRELHKLTEENAVKAQVITGK